MQENHPNNSDEETEYSLPTNHLEGLESVVLKNPFLHDKLGRGEDLSASNKKNTDNSARSGGCSGSPNPISLDGSGFFFEESTSEANNSHTEDNNKEGEPLEGTEVALEEEDAEDANEEDKGSTGHLVDFGY